MTASASSRRPSACRGGAEAPRKRRGRLRTNPGAWVARVDYPGAWVARVDYPGAWVARAGPPPSPVPLPVPRQGRGGCRTTGSPASHRPTRPGGRGVPAGDG